MNQLITTFYTSFKELNAEAMVACYHDDVTFRDPAFGVLKGEHAKNMWRMLIASQKNKTFQIHFDSIVEAETTGSAHWEAKYKFSKTGKKVHNIIEAKFVIKDGLILEHTDSFNLHRWATQALGFKGFLLGWSGYFKKKLQAQTNRLLVEFEKNS